MNATARITPASCDVTVTRVFDAPRDLVFRTWIEPAHFTQWWGPRGFTNPVCELDARPGGGIFVRMHGPSDHIVLMRGTFREIVAPQHIVFTAIVADCDGVAMFEGLVTATFEDEGGATKLTVREQAVAIDDAIAAPILANMETSWTESLKRLAAVISPDT
jgi:uncharacterized protein YndB with AHSA1/START domain